VTLIVQLKELINKPGNMKEVVLEHTVSEAIGTEVMGIPAGSTLSIPVRLESVHEGILASAEFTASATGICSRCLDEIARTSMLKFKSSLCIGRSRRMTS